MKKGFALPLVIAIFLIIAAASTIVYYKFYLNNYDPNVNDAANMTNKKTEEASKPSSLASATPTAYQQRVSANEAIDCSKNQVGNIKFKPPIGWKKISYECQIYTAPGTEENYPFGSPEQGAQLSISFVQRLVTDDCKSIDDLSYVVPIKCTTLNGNKLAVYEINYEGVYLVYSLIYKDKAYEFRIGSGQRDSYRYILDQMVNNLEFL